MIRISLGNPGSGKTACTVRDLVLNKSNRNTYSNIQTKKLKNNILIDPTMIVNKEIVDYKKKRSGETEAVYKYNLNKDFWFNVEKPVNVILDEAHSIINSRRSMTKVNQIVGDWMALIRRVLGSSDSGYGELVLITQLWNKIDINARDMATNVRYHRCHYVKRCRCNFAWRENNDDPEPIHLCPKCNSYQIKKTNHIIEVWHFKDMNSFIAFYEYQAPTFHRHYYIKDIEKYFGYYDTLQWDNMFSDLY